MDVFILSSFEKIACHDFSGHGYVLRVASSIKRRKHTLGASATFGLAGIVFGVSLLMRGQVHSVHSV
jgi:hypothetical protein